MASNQNVAGTVDSWMVGRRISETPGIDRGAGDLDLEGTRLLFGFNCDVLNKKTDGVTTLLVSRLKSSKGDPYALHAADIH